MPGGWLWDIHKHNRSAESHIIVFRSGGTGDNRHLPFVHHGEHRCAESAQAQQKLLL